MRSKSNKSSALLGTALATAAMMLPSLQFASADVAPERGIISFKYLNYQEHQDALGTSVASPGPAVSENTDDEDKIEKEHGSKKDDAVWVNLVSGASALPTSTPSVLTPSSVSSTTGSTAADRISVNAYSIMAMVPIAGKWSLATTFISDSVSGASPIYHTSGLTHMTDSRSVVDAQLTRYFPSGNVTVGTSYSKETDYLSRSYSLQGSLSTEDKNTTFTLGGSITNDTITPKSLSNVTETKNINAALIGVTRVLSKNDIIQINVGYSKGEGYYSDPYKYYDLRPDKRNNTTVMGRWNHHFESSDGTARTSYRYYTDTFGIKAHTLEGEYVQPLGNGLTVAPLLRLYTQNEADFYIATSAAEQANPLLVTTPSASAVYYSLDQRLSAFGAVTLGLKVSKQLGPDWLVDGKVEFYEQRSEWALSGHADKALAPFSARSIQLGISREF